MYPFEWSSSRVAQKKQIRLRGRCAFPRAHSLVGTFSELPSPFRQPLRLSPEITLTLNSSSSHTSYPTPPQMLAALSLKYTHVPTPNHSPPPWVSWATTLSDLTPHSATAVTAPWQPAWSLSKIRSGQSVSLRIKPVLLLLANQTPWPVTPCHPALAPAVLATAVALLLLLTCTAHTPASGPLHVSL